MCLPTPGFLWDLGTQKVNFRSSRICDFYLGNCAPLPPPTHVWKKSSQIGVVGVLYVLTKWKVKWLTCADQNVPNTFGFAKKNSVGQWWSKQLLIDSTRPGDVFCWLARTTTDGALLSVNHVFFHKNASPGFFVCKMWGKERPQCNIYSFQIGKK